MSHGRHEPADGKPVRCRGSDGRIPGGLQPGLRAQPGTRVGRTHAEGKGTGTGLSVVRLRPEVMQPLVQVLDCARDRGCGVSNARVIEQTFDVS